MNKRWLYEYIIYFLNEDVYVKLTLIDSPHAFKNVFHNPILTHGSRQSLPEYHWRYSFEWTDQCDFDFNLKVIEARRINDGMYFLFQLIIGMFKK